MEGTSSYKLQAASYKKVVRPPLVLEVAANSCVIAMTTQAANLKSQVNETLLLAA
jgi:hypothetical protein